MAENQLTKVVGDHAVTINQSGVQMRTRSGDVVAEFMSDGVSLSTSSNTQPQRLTQEKAAPPALAGIGADKLVAMAGGGLLAYFAVDSLIKLAGIAACAYVGYLATIGKKQS